MFKIIYFGFMSLQNQLMKNTVVVLGQFSQSHVLPSIAWGVASPRQFSSEPRFRASPWDFVGNVCVEFETVPDSGQPPYRDACSAASLRATPVERSGIAFVHVNAYNTPGEYMRKLA